jgi:chorismate mutase-like protein
MTTGIEDLRADIDAVDADLVKLLARRFAAVEKIARLKAENGIPVVIPERIDAVQDRVARLTEEAGLDPAVARRLWRAIIDEAVAMEAKEIGGG